MRGNGPSGEIDRRGGASTPGVIRLLIVMLVACSGATPAPKEPPRQKAGATYGALCYGGPPTKPDSVPECEEPFVCCHVCEAQVCDYRCMTEPDCRPPTWGP